jgi:hypothetical protein
MSDTYRLRTIEEGATTDYIHHRRAKHLRAKRIRRWARFACRGFVQVALLAVAWRLVAGTVDRRMQSAIQRDLCGGLEYMHPLLRRVPVLHIINASAVWFPSYVVNKTSTKLRTFEQSIVCPSRTPRLRHTAVRVHGALTGSVHLTGVRATCAAHRLDFLKYGNCSF